MKKLLPIVLMLLIAINLLSSQSYTNRSQKEKQTLFINSIRTAEYIFEGEIIRKESFYSEKTQSNMLSTFYNVTRVIKGNIKVGTIEVVGYNYWDLLSKEGRHSIKLQEKQYGFFFGQPLNYIVESSDLFIPDNKTRLMKQPNYLNTSFVEYCNCLPEVNSPLLGIYFESISDFYFFLNKKANLKIKPIPPFKSKPLNTPPSVDSAVIKHDKERWDAYQKLLEHKKQFVK